MTEPPAATEGVRDAVRAARAAWQPAQIAALTRLTPRVMSVRLAATTWRTFLPGQHVDVRLTADDGYQAQRSYSVASAPGDEGTWELVIEALPDGEVSSYFHEAAAVGDRVEVRGPFAEHFVWRPAFDAPVFLAAGGSGVAPFLSMVRHRARLAPAERPPMLLLYSARSWDEVIAADELLAHEAAQPGLQVIFCLTRGTPPRPTDFARRVDGDILQSALARLPVAPRESFVCGRNAFVNVVADLLVESGVPASTVRTERYGGA